jgi:hypothetical protein
MKIGQKNYTEVSERVRIFKADYPGFKLQTDMVHYEPGVRVIFKATIYNEKNEIEATGYAEEEKGEPVLSNGKANINYDNYVEICETSAVGRALGFIGIGIDNGIASADEVVNAVNRQQSRTVAATTTTSTASKEEIKWWDGSGNIALYEHFMVNDQQYKCMKNSKTNELFGLNVNENAPAHLKFYKFV